MGYPHPIAALVARRAALRVWVLATVRARRVDAKVAGLLSLLAKLRAAGPCVLTAKRMRLARAMRLRGRRPRRMERLRRPLGRAALE